MYVSFLSGWKFMEQFLVKNYIQHADQSEVCIWPRGGQSAGGRQETDKARSPLSYTSYQYFNFFKMANLISPLQKLQDINLYYP
jgi:hypothetical protein